MRIGSSSSVRRGSVMEVVEGVHVVGSILQWPVDSPDGRTGPGEREAHRDGPRDEGSTADRPCAGPRHDPARGAEVIAVVSTVMTFVAGVLMTVIDHENFPSIGSGLWWAVQTVTTVGYGDDVPTTIGGRLVASAVMLFGIGFLTVITASITSTFVARSRGEVATAATVEAFGQIDRRLERIEAALKESS